MSEQAGRGATAVEDRSIARLIQDMTDQLGRLVRDELRLAVEELRQKGKRAGVGAGLTGVAGVSALFGGATLVAAAVLALALILPAWLAALLIGAALLVIGGLAGLAGRRELRSAVPPVPEEAVSGVVEDVKVIRAEGSRGGHEA